jgi:hypothetical protein
LDDFLIGPHVLPNRLTGEAYFDFFVNTMPQLLEKVLLQVCQSLWYTHDTAPAHFSIQMRNHLNKAYPVKWIGCSSPVAGMVTRPQSITLFHLGTPQDLGV